ncbi:helix-turn-helix transcriptional regulator [uncultured Acinetobacter sp.]|uniref:AraC family transcriptional regulator n=1 Tax=uncultured Acinetobacter sp. TaxID=165433 RepID=UPI002587A73A|nr:helix-turn-helix transcriptional regulator [uncultured Acinetobacter sp.]
MQTLLKNSSILTFTDPVEASSFVLEHVGNHEIRLLEKIQNTASIDHRQAVALDICQIQYGSEVEICCETLGDAYHLQFMLSGQCEWTDEQGSTDFLTGQIMMVNPDQFVKQIYGKNVRKFIIKIPTTIMKNACDKLGLTTSGDELKFQMNKYDINQCENFLSFLQLFCTEAEHADNNSNLIELYNDIMVNKILTTLSHNAKYISTNYPASFESLLHYIDDFLTQDISLEYMQTITCTSQRSLYNLFDRYLKCSPKQYVKNRKLIKINEIIRNRSIDLHNISEIAIEYGFYNLGRFAKEYKNKFGELPSETFRKRRS